MSSLLRTFSICLSLVAVSVAAGQTFQDVANEAKQARVDAEKELDSLRREYAALKQPIARQIKELEDEYLFLQTEVDRVTQLAQEKDNEIASQRSEVAAMNSDVRNWKLSMAAYIGRLSTTVNEVDFLDYKEGIDRVDGLVTDESAAPEDVMKAQLGVLADSIERLKRSLGGQIKAGKVSIDAENQVDGTFALIGPVIYFSDGQTSVGIARPVVNLAYPIIFNKGFTPEELEGMKQMVADGKGIMPLDTTGDAIRMIDAQDTFWGHIVKGGITMIPLLGMFAIAIFVAIGKVIEIYSVQCPKPGLLPQILDKVNAGDKSNALSMAQSVKGPFGDLLSMGVEHSEDPKEVLEEALYERLLAAQPKLERFLSYLALSAAAAPLLGLLGTVTGMIQTFKAINVVGTGDPATLSDGISVALITTEYGLIVAIPCLVAHVLLSRFAKSKIARMEEASVAFVNGLHHTIDR